jgi:hypothetical protein
MAGKHGWKAWLEGMAGEHGWKAWEHGWEAWLEIGWLEKQSI